MSAATRRLLVVDDDPPSRALAVAIFLANGWTVDEAEGGREALVLVDEKHYDCVLLDISMPGMSGEDVCRRIRSDPHHAGLRIVAYTAYAFVDDVDLIRAAGFDDVVVKPCTVDRMIVAVEGRR
jgi:CheY-like chemotaxis protein